MMIDLFRKMTICHKEKKYTVGLNNLIERSLIYNKFGEKNYLFSPWLNVIKIPDEFDEQDVEFFVENAILGKMSSQSVSFDIFCLLHIFQIVLPQKCKIQVKYRNKSELFCFVNRAKLRGVNPNYFLREIASDINNFLNQFSKPNCDDVNDIKSLSINDITTIFELSNNLNPETAFNFIGDLYQIHGDEALILLHHFPIISECDPFRIYHKLTLLTCSYPLGNFLYLYFSKEQNRENKKNTIKKKNRIFFHRIKAK
ncbi:hypothetical protein TRFO_40578 [Tritrichomonas foetus]|uniref:Uncharacterized protein n=1 Tax=Tritrichomonas foetus TaxID=1144522 RepID=A0A1J4J0C2_9EUKA|nr:hypothetical protein TRFO_40578 [Tritrichomonas foetus]|eukprot:OHS93110.1 hypothetical protein TRFO_40578 [Tritrichomonas foetus]